MDTRVGEGDDTVACLSSSIKALELKKKKKKAAKFIRLKGGQKWKSKP
jgi:hypothetical protein